MVLLFQYGVSKHGIGGLTDMLMAQRTASTESKFLSLGFIQHPSQNNKLDNLLHTDSLLEIGEYPRPLWTHAVGI